MTDTTLDLSQLPDQLRRLEPPVREDVLAIVDQEHAHWRQLHDRLVALIAALLEIAATDRRLDDVIDTLIGETTMGLDELVGARVDAGEVAALLRAHGSVGRVEVDGDTTTFRHACGSGQHYWRENPQTPKVVEGEVEGVPGGRPQYCARCVRSISSHGGGAWTVTPPPDTTVPCVWTVRTGDVGSSGT